MKILKPNLYSKYIRTPIGEILAISNENALLFFEFRDWKGLDKSLQKLNIDKKNLIFENEVFPLQCISQEIDAYFSGVLRDFATPLMPIGTFFQISVWNELSKIPYGETLSYLSLANKLQKPTAYRAVANANACNLFGIIIPCHRVINENGNLGGYGGGIYRKEWLLAHEKKYMKL